MAAPNVAGAAVQPQPALPAPATSYAQAPVAAPPQPAAPQATQVAAAQPVPVYSDAGPPPVQPAPPAVAPAPSRAVQNAGPTTARPAPQVASNRLGRVTSVAPIRERPAGTGVGGIAGGAVGGLVGNHFGGGTGRAALTVLGVVGGAVAGNQVERNVRERTVGYRVEVRLDNGDVRTFDEQAADLRVGDRVRVTGGSLRRI